MSNLQEFLKSRAVHLASWEERDAFFKICIENGLEVFDPQSDWEKWTWYTIENKGQYRLVNGYGKWHPHMMECQKLSFQEFLEEWNEGETEQEDQELSMMEVLL